MQHEKDIKVDSSELSDAASKLIVSICNKENCSPKEALKIVLNQIAKEAA